MNRTSVERQQTTLRQQRRASLILQALNNCVELFGCFFSLTTQSVVEIDENNDEFIVNEAR